MLGSRNIFPRLLEGIRLIRADEGGHLTHGMDYLREEKISEKPYYAEPLRQLFSARRYENSGADRFRLPAQ